MEKRSVNLIIGGLIAMPLSDNEDMFAAYSDCSIYNGSL